MIEWALKNGMMCVYVGHKSCVSDTWILHLPGHVAIVHALESWDEDTPGTRSLMSQLGLMFIVS